MLLKHRLKCNNAYVIAFFAGLKFFLLIVGDCWTLNIFGLEGMEWNKNERNLNCKWYKIE